MQYAHRINIQTDSKDPICLSTLNLVKIPCFIWRCVSFPRLVCLEVWHPNSSIQPIVFPNMSLWGCFHSPEPGNISYTPIWANETATSVYGGILTEREWNERVTGLTPAVLDFFRAAKTELHNKVVVCKHLVHLACTCTKVV